MESTSSPPRHSVLVIGCGSIGERHLRCFRNTGRTQVAVCDTNAGLVGEVAARYGVPGFASLDAALAAFPAEAWVICTPAHTHLPIARRGMEIPVHLLIEKPLAVSLEGVAALQERLKSYPRHVAVAYVYHTMPWMLEMRTALLSGELGPPKHATVVAGQHFPTFRPTYRELYYARHESGGGAIQDGLTHMANVIEWLLGPSTRLFCDAAHQVLDGVEVEDTVNISARNGGVMVNYAYNQFQAPSEAEIRIHCERGSLAMQLGERRWGTFRHGEPAWTWHVHPAVERDDWFIRQANSFLDGVEGKPSVLCTFDEAVQTLKFNLAALESARIGKAVEIS
ncbi:MAG: Gfo/Idh/MocA family oxidoreductase [Prosthecobacter sp.]|nr:Gfo/Idh/MocA family oxidoreductase [Prosthecobacter sp.]